MLVYAKYALTDATLGAAALKTDYAVVTREGRILDAGPRAIMQAKYPDEETLGGGTQLLMSGLIDAHTHGAGLSYVQRGVQLSYLENSLMDFAGSVNLDPETNAQLSALRHIKNGCTTLHANIMGAPSNPQEYEQCARRIEGYRSTGIRFAFSPGIRNENILALDDRAFLATLPGDLQAECAPLVNIDAHKATEDYLAVFRALHERYDGERCKVILGPNWVQGSTDELLQSTHEHAAKYDVPIHLHCLQTPTQKAYGLRRYGKSLVMHLEDLGLVDKHLVLGHAVYLDQADIELLASRGAMVTHHPSCNFAVRNGIAPVSAMLRACLHVALGIDEKGFNDDEDPFAELRMAFLLHRVASHDLTSAAMSPADALAMGTVAGSRPCGFGKELGALTPGKAADVILVDLDEILGPWADEDNLLHLFIHRALGRFVNTVMIGGDVVMKDRRVLTIDEQVLYEKVREQASRGPTAAQKKQHELMLRVRPHLQAWYNGWLKELKLDPYYALNSKT